MNSKPMVAKGDEIYLGAAEILSYSLARLYRSF